MTTPGLLAPPRAARPRVIPPDVKPPPAPPPEPKPRPSFERVLGWSLATSVLIHLLLLLLSPIYIRVEVPPGAAAASSEAAATQSFGMEMIIAIPSADAPELPAIERREEPPVPQRPTPAQPSRVVPGSRAAPGPVPGDQPRQSASDALRPGFRDARLYVAPRQFPNLEQTDHERYMEHLQARIDAINDSMAVASNRERQTSDWTVTDGSGNRWGVSDDERDGDPELHLGPITIPDYILPNIRSSGDNQQIEDRREQQRQREEIRRQAEEQERRERQDERIDATREAQDQSRGGGGGN